MRHALSVQRLNGNPIVSREATEGAGANLSDPSLIRAAAWVAEPLGRYVHVGGVSVTVRMHFHGDDGCGTC